MTHVVGPSYLKEEDAQQLAMWLWRNAGVAFAPCKLPHCNISNGQDYTFAVTRVVDGKLLDASGYRPKWHLGASGYRSKWQYLHCMAWPELHKSHGQKALAVYRQWEKDNPINHGAKNGE